MRPGDHLPSEGAFCEMLSMSKASVREGIRRLELLGVVEVRHGRGLFVGEFSFDPVIDALPYKLRIDETPLLEILQIRAAIEEGLIVHAAEALSGDDLDELDRLVSRMRQTSVNGEVTPEIDKAFHLALFAPLKNTLLNELIEMFWLVYAKFAEESSTEVNHHAVEDHAEIVSAVRSGDRARMTRAIAVHFAPIQVKVELVPTNSPAGIERDS